MSSAPPYQLKFGFVPNPVARHWGKVKRFTRIAMFHVF
jgi:hypothetical protein